MIDRDIYTIKYYPIDKYGYEFFSHGVLKHKIFKWHNTPTHHNMHHKFVKNNYGLYFNFWDRVMKTNHPKYDEYYNVIIDRREAYKARKDALRGTTHKTPKSNT